MKRQRWAVGDIFLVPQSDGKFMPGQILDQLMPHVVSIVLFDRIVDASELLQPLPRTTEAISCVTTWKQAFSTGAWRIVGSAEPLLPRLRRPYEQLRKDRWIGLDTYDWGLIEDFANAYRGLQHWDDWHDPNFLDEFLLPPATRPPGITFKPC
jgi:hypothetical protein